MKRITTSFSRLAVFLAALILVACGLQRSPFPETRRGDVVDVIHGESIADPYRWLEAQQDPATRDWIDRQNAFAETVIGESPLRDELRERFRQLLDVADLGSPESAGGFDYFTLRRAGEELASIYRRPKPEGDAIVKLDPSIDYELVLDPGGMSSDHTTRVDIESLHPDGHLLLYSVRDGGQDEVELRLRDLAAGVDLPESLPWGLYSSVAFAKDGSGFLYTHRSRSTGPRALFHRLGTPVEDDVVLFGEGYGPRSFVTVAEIDDHGGSLFTVQHGWSSTELHVGNRLLKVPPRPLVTGLEARTYGRFDEGELFAITNFKAPNNRIVVIDPANSGSSANSVSSANSASWHDSSADEWREVIPETDHVLEDFAVIEGRLYVTYLVDASARIRVFERDGTFVSELALPDHHSAGIRPGGPGKAILTLESFLQPSVSYLVDLETEERELWRGTEVPFDGSRWMVEQQWFASKDGTRVPIFLVRSKAAASGPAPAYLTGYGGFNAALTPRFNALAAVWLEQGGLFAQPSLRGGSEFGETWHRGGMLENKQNVFDDFLGAAEWLIDAGATRPDLLAIQGASNGGLLVASAFTQRPELFSAVLCGFPDLDMVRFNTFTETNNMPALLEYGDAGLSVQFEFLRRYSPYQAVKPGTDYPAVMLTSGDHDTRVPPLQARKMVATLQYATASRRPVILRYSASAGHAAGRGVPMSQEIEDRSAELAFLLTQVGSGGDH